MTEPALRLRSATVDFGDVRALDGVELSVYPGELVAVTGHSGAGKTTLLSALAGIVRLTSGTATVQGVEVVDRDQSVGLGVAIVPQGNALSATLTAAENVLVPVLAAGTERSEAERRTAEALAAVGLADSRGHLVDELSGGQQQRVAVARGLALATPILLADEPTSELDHDNRELVLDLLISRAGAGAAVVMTTNDLEAASRADRVVALDDGRVITPAG